MSTTFPEIDIPVGKRTQKWGKEFIDAAVDQHNISQTERKTIIKKMYNSYNGIHTSTAGKFITMKYGKSLSTKYIDYKLGRTKVKLLLGESLDIRLSTRVETVNPKAKYRKMEAVKKVMALSMVSEELRAIEQKFGLNPGQEIPKDSSADTLLKMTPKEINELIMQRILDNKIKEDKIRIKALESMTDIILASECHAKVDRDHNGKDVVVIFAADKAMFQESSNDPFCERTPYSGDVRIMYLHDIILRWGTELGKEKIKKLKDLQTDFAENNEFGAELLNGSVVFNVYTTQWSAPRPKYTKISKNKNSDVSHNVSLSNEYVEKNNKRIKKELEKNLYSLKSDWIDDIYTITRIGKDTYVEFGKVNGTIQTRSFNNKYRGQTDYVHCLYGTVHGVRISLQEIIHNLSEIYNVVMFMITREIKKMKGMVFTYDEALRPKDKSTEDVLYDMTEHGVVLINSAEDLNFGGKDVQSLSSMVQALDLGVSNSFKSLLDLKANVEYTLDRITGINSDREGWGKASQTATMGTQNVEASRSITKDMFYYWNVFMENLLTKLVEKTKTNWDWIDSDAGEMLMGESGVMFLRASRDLTNDDYKVRLGDGKKELDIKERSRMFIQQEINKGALRSKDAIRYEMADTLNEGLAVLDQAWKEVNNIQREQMQSKEEIAAKDNQAAIEGAREDREDRQQHEKDVVILKESERRVTEGMKIDAQQENETERNVTQKQISDSKIKK